MFMANENTKKKPNIKKFLKGAAAVALIAPTLTAGTVYLVANAKTDDYSSQKQIETIADGLDADISVMKFLAKENDHVKRLKHNDGDPIYIKIQDGYPEKFENIARDSVDYVFSIVGGVNDLYKNYEYVDQRQSEALEEQGKTVIEYNMTDNLDNLVGGITFSNHVGDWYNLLTSKQVVKTPEIIMNFERLKDYNDNIIKTTYVHELLHVFGFGDVYNDKTNFETNTYYGNTIMHAGRMMPIITSNDYACIMSAYAKPMKKNELNNYINKCQKQLSSYEDYYYEELATFSEKLNSQYLNNKVEFTDGENHSNFTLQTTEIDGSTIIENINIVCENDTYSITIMDENNNVIDTVSGKARLISGAYVLENAEFEKNIRPLSDMFMYDGYLTDLVLYRTENRDFLFNPSDNAMYWGNEFQKQIEK